MDEIEEISTFGGMIAFCNYCGTTVDPFKKLIHIRDEKHREMTSNGILCFEDRSIELKGDLLSQTEEEFHTTKDLVLTCEKTLKMVSDEFFKKAEGDTKQKKETMNNSVDVSDDSSSDESDEENMVSIPQKRILRGVMRAGSLANGLLMQGERHLMLVVLCEEKPTNKILKDLHKCFVNILPIASNSMKLNVELIEEESCIMVKPVGDQIQMECKIAITSPKCRLHPFKLFNERLFPDPKDMLPRTKCEEMLRVLRQARWFESKCYSHQHSEVILKVLLNICKQDVDFAAINEWLLQCLFHKVISIADSSGLTLVGLFQRFFECLSSGILLPDSPTFQDPCEREPKDLRDELTIKQKLAITIAAQRTLRLIALKQVPTILGLTKQDIKTLHKSSIGALKRKGMDKDENIPKKRRL